MTVSYPSAPPAPYATTPALAPQPQAMPTYYAPPAPQPVYVAPARGGSNAALGLIVILLALAAAAGGWFMAREQAPTTEEVARYQALAAQEGFRSAQLSGIGEGRSFAIESQRRVTQLRAAIARQRAWNRGYRKGQNAGMNSYRRPSYSRGYRGGYRAPARRYYGPTNNQTAVRSAVASAQQLANATGAPVDVEIY